MKTSVLIFAFFASSVAAANGFVGNGGEGVRIDGRLVVRDLYEMEVTRPSFGTADARMLEDVRGATVFAPLGVDEEKLAAKLTDLESIVEGLGFSVLQILSGMYTINPVSSLPLLADSPEVPLLGGDREARHVPRERRVQLAVRNSTIIALSLPAFRELSPSQRVALLIHEGLYALIRPDCGPADGRSGGSAPLDTCGQREEWIYEIVGRLFSPGFQDDRRLSRLIEERLLLPTRPQICGSDALTLSFQSASCEERDPSCRREARLENAGRSLDQAMERFCGILPESSGIPSAGFELGLVMRSLVPETYYYALFPPSMKETAVAVRLNHQATRWTRSLEELSRRDCPSRLKAFVVNWLSHSGILEASRRRAYCSADFPAL